MPRVAIPPRLRFDQRYVPEPNSGCWLWEGWIVPKTGYGLFQMRPGAIQCGAHRAAWLLYRGEIPDKMQVCHRCDNRACVNPDHLFLGTAHDNMRDAANKGRMKWKPNAPPRALPRGEAHHSAVLTEESVAAIRASDAPGVSLARQYGVSPNTIGRVRQRLTWGHVH